LQQELLQFLLQIGQLNLETKLQRRNNI
jgi:hypothetical protein